MRRPSEPRGAQVFASETGGEDDGSFAGEHKNAKLLPQWLFNCDQTLR